MPEASPLLRGIEHWIIIVLQQQGDKIKQWQLVYLQRQEATSREDRMLLYGGESSVLCN